MHQYELVSKDISIEKEAKNILYDAKGMTTEEKVKLLFSKDPTLSQRAIAKTLGISATIVNRYLKI